MFLVKSDPANEASRVDHTRDTVALEVLMNRVTVKQVKLVAPWKRWRKLGALSGEVPA
jgi:hypothetical protein